MLNFECPRCDEENEIEAEDLPERACDSRKFNCIFCDAILTIGRTAGVEVRAIEPEEE